METQNLSLVENAETLSCQFIPELEGVRNQGRLNGWNKPTWIATGHKLDNVLWCIGFGVKPTSKRWV
jgi:hypothetical protein